MTATPTWFDKKQKNITQTHHMSNEEIFGGTIYTYHYAHGIKDGWLATCEMPLFAADTTMPIELADDETFKQIIQKLIPKMSKHPGHPKQDPGHPQQDPDHTTTKEALGIRETTDEWKFQKETPGV